MKHFAIRKSSPRILQVSTYDGIGGAEKVALGLSKVYQAHGYESWMAVGHKLSTDPSVVQVPNDEHRTRWFRLWDNLESRVQPIERRGAGATRFRHLVQAIREPGRALDRYRGIESFRFPGTWQLLALTPRRPDIVHCHNLHGEYFDLRALPWLSQQVPLVMTLHDAWLLSGHCAHSFDCERWRTGCGRCPDLTIDPAVRRDATAYNWRRKRDIFADSRLFIATPSQWLMKKVEQSMLAPGVLEARVIPNGVDLSVFHPSGQNAARAALGLSSDTFVVMFAANSVRRNPFKDYETVREAVAAAAGRVGERAVVLLAVGDQAPPERIGSARVEFRPYEADPEAMARCYQAADVYVHAARADTFPNTVLEALACGTPVVATAVGGIPEQVEDGDVGFLVAGGDVRALAQRVTELLCDGELRRQMGIRGAETARRRFDVVRQADDYLSWYHELVSRAPSKRFVMAS
jgi:glycosyltransferase involved in cell wall biosynthesis